MPSQLYSTAEAFSISLCDELGRELLHFTNHNTHTYLQYVMNTGTAGGEAEIRQSGALLEHMMVEVEIKVTATHYQSKINGESLPGRCFYEQYFKL